ncbi:DUF5677 domain-containing protein [Idiomarina sp. Sol25]|uniref:DUF5677 domain-containing protein n=1 Tax=Idiomarina sp. Sol25 TaxID=3064000 RepID=UPI00294B77A6|nr:DUF5677 domain-containing protein [Idiomarina sp. Sol25]MDV6328556.1 DUF5677 domain-containing protein [Idiomarina sp. Sol25]
MDESFNQWASIASEFIHEHFQFCQPYLDNNYQGINEQLRFVSTQLYLSTHFTSESSLVLLGEGREWDSEILNRSVVEGVIKYVYMLQGEESDQVKKVSQFWDILPKYAAVKRSDRAKKLLNKVEDDEERKAWFSIEKQVLSCEEVGQIRTGSNKRSRSLLEQNWSFSRILDYFAESGDQKLRWLALLAYSYGMSSHLVHKDGDGVSMIWERCIRPEERRNAVKAAHIARSVSDICTLSEIRSLFLVNLCKESSRFIEDVRSKYALFFSELKRTKDVFDGIEYPKDTNNTGKNDESC